MKSLLDGQLARAKPIAHSVVEVPFDVIKKGIARAPWGKEVSKPERNRAVVFGGSITALIAAFIGGAFFGRKIFGK